jgi:hypothetical protein
MIEDPRFLAEMRPIISLEQAHHFRTIDTNGVEEWIRPEFQQFVQPSIK